MAVKSEAGLETPPTVPRGKVAFDPQTFRWNGVEPRAYKFTLGDARGMGWRAVTRYTMSARPQAATDVEVRYFELAPGGYSSLEKHAYAHMIVVLRGKGKALVGDQVFEISPFDLVHVPPEVPHRWINEGDEPFGFLCPVDAERDPPRPIDDAEWESLRQNPVTSSHVF